MHSSLRPYKQSTTAVLGSLATTGLAAMDTPVGGAGVGSALARNLSVAAGRANVRFTCAVSPDSRRLTGRERLILLTTS
jgi:hypothetical protein